MICNKCNFQNEETAKFCKNCGVKLSPKRKSSSMLWIISVIALIVCAVAGYFLFSDNSNLPEKVQLLGTITYCDGRYTNMSFKISAKIALFSVMTKFDQKSFQQNFSSLL